jgi:hypothetical protein
VLKALQDGIDRSEHFRAAGRRLDLSGDENAVRIVADAENREQDHQLELREKFAGQSLIRKV